MISPVTGSIVTSTHSVVKCFTAISCLIRPIPTHRYSDGPHYWCVDRLGPPSGLQFSGCAGDRWRGQAGCRSAFWGAVKEVSLSGDYFWLPQIEKRVLTRSE